LNASLITYWSFFAVFILYMVYVVRRGRISLRISKENTLAIQENTAALHELTSLNRQFLEKQNQATS
jgi:hypothetical protein